MCELIESLHGVNVLSIGDNEKLVNKYGQAIVLVCGYDPSGVCLKVYKDKSPGSSMLSEYTVTGKTTNCPSGAQSHVLIVNDEMICIKFQTKNDTQVFRKILQRLSGKVNSVFNMRTEDSSASQYFQFYGYLSQQQNMMQDFVRTSTYQRAIYSNSPDFHNKVVLDVGAGSGILSFFAVQAGAAKVYAVEASNMAQFAQQLVHSNNLSNKIEVVSGKIEEIELPEMVDVIISEPMGYMLYNERMLETYLHGKKWLKPGGRMFPSRGDLHVAPFTDESLYMEQYNKANFWMQSEFHGVNLCFLRDAAMKEYFRQPIVDTFDIRICMAKSIRHTTDFLKADEKDLHRIAIPVEFHFLETGSCHGLAFWFDVAFSGSCTEIWLSTAPTEPLTHWYQVRCLLATPIFVKQGQVLTGSVVLLANQRQSYDVDIDLKLEGTIIRSQNTLDLKNPYFRYTGQPVAPPPGSNTTSPSEAYWGQLDAQGARNAVNLVNGITVNGLGEVDMSSTIINTNLMAIGNQPNIHPGLISSSQISGRPHQSGMRFQDQAVTNMAGLSPGTATSTQNAGQHQLINAGIRPGPMSPSMFANTHHGTAMHSGQVMHGGQPIHGNQFY